MKYANFYTINGIALIVAEENNRITNISFQNAIIGDYIKKETPIIKETVTQLTEYFMGNRKKFVLPLEIKGTEFRKKVWNALIQIPYGETRTYQQIAKEIGCPQGQRAVGLANNKNQIAIVIPCHRVIGANGRLIGYAGGLNIKQKLLELEKYYA